MKPGILALAGLMIVAACGQSIQGRCAAAHPGDNAAYKGCVAQEQAALEARLPKPKRKD